MTPVSLQEREQSRRIFHEMSRRQRSTCQCIHSPKKHSPSETTIKGKKKKKERGQPTLSLGGTLRGLAPGIFTVLSDGASAFTSAVILNEFITFDI
jgi:hypothetical protein